VKLLTFTRTLTILYSTTLLSLFTTVQLTLLGRSKYVEAILQLERDERSRENVELNFSSSPFGRGLDMVDLEMTSAFEEGDISDELEGKFLSLSWWILHVGWKDVGERVRRGVEEVFDGVSLKSKLGAIDLHRLVNDVRRRVEYEVTFEGTERRIDFLSTLLPPTPETMTHVLTQAGIPSHVATLHTPVFTSLLDETRTTIISADFQRVLEVCLDRATEMLFDGLHSNVFVDDGKRVDDNGSELRLRLAGLLPGLARWSHLALNGLPNELVDGLMDVREATGLSAIVFSKFEDRFR
jgi:peroxin-3